MVGCFPLILAWFGNALFGQYRHRRCRHVQAGWGSDSDCDTDSDTDTDTDSDTDSDSDLSGFNRLHRWG
ncbi:MAG: hypothetical protein AUK55_03845 [Syntrophobacteraceae bacterium CG2_30_61_12]|nr:MAG: hypothetical protein AUK55_03845 [Syntrophobacteraceae bacterium CG2_30_61_12]